MGSIIYGLRYMLIALAMLIIAMGIFQAVGV